MSPAYLLLLYSSIYILFQVILLVRLKYFSKPVIHKPDFKPTVSILIAARNEEQHILSCLQALQQLQYPKELMEVWIGNDQSTDGTEQLVLDYIKNKPNSHLVSIETVLGKAKGKANVLAQLTHKARGEFFFITDADIEVPPNWINGMLAGFEKNTGIVSGSTTVKGNGILARIQRTDWTYASAMIHVVSEMNLPVTAIGNNMAIRRSCYESTGGYENMPFSVTEDLELFKATLKQGWHFRNLMNASTTCVSAPLPGLKAILNQRKRWMTGALKLPFLLTFCLTIQALFFPVMVHAFFLVPPLWVIAFALTIFNLQTWFIETSAKQMGIGSLRRDLLLFELNRYIFPSLMFVHSFMPGVNWKGRTYTGKEIQP